jgi:ribosomal protein S12 methylthiotransferase
MNKPSRYYLLSLGCAKNTVDSAGMAQLLERAGWGGVESPAEADLLIVNTCGFIAPAREESLQALRELGASKRLGQLLIAAGCLSQLIGEELTRQVPELDGVLGTRRWMDLMMLVARLRRGAPLPQVHLPPEALVVGQDEQGVLRAAVQGPSAYLKIADGCRRPCAFCSIPLIKGTAVSRPADRIIAEAIQLAQMGVKELVLIAQDTSDYGHDRGEKDGLAQLLERLVAAVPGLPWIRVMYAYPGCVTPRLMETMARHPQILPYLDIPLQHAHADVLKRMRRPASVDWVRETIRELRRLMPDIAIRTTFIVGYPGESETEFRALLDFAQEMRFDRLGTFSYWPEEGTPAALLGGQVPDEVKGERHERLMMLQQDISLSANLAQVGRTLDVLIEGHGDGISVGRSYRDAPEIDGLVILEQELPVGEMVPVRITGAMAYDLTGQVEGGASAAAFAPE